DIDGTSPNPSGSPVLVMQQDVDATYAGKLLGSFPVIKRGAGMLTLTSTASDNQQFVIEQGGLAMPAGADGVFSSDTFSLRAATTVRVLSDGHFSSLEFLQSSTLDTNGHRVTAGFLRGGTSQQAIVTKIGAGVLSVSNADAYGIRVMGGSLEITEDPF